MAEFIEISKRIDSKVQAEKSKTTEKYNIESYSTQSKLGQNALVQSKVFEQAKNILPDTFENMDFEIKQENNITEFLENKTGLPDCKVIEEMNRLGFWKNYPKEGVIGLWIDWITCLILINATKTKYNKTKIFKKTFVLMMIFS